MTGNADFAMKMAFRCLNALPLIQRKNLKKGNEQQKQQQLMLMKIKTLRQHSSSYRKGQKRSN